MYKRQPSDYLVERFINEDLLAELDLNNIPNFKYVEEVSKTRTFDPESVSYTHLDVYKRQAVWQAWKMKSR